MLYLQKLPLSARFVGFGASAARAVGAFLLLQGQSLFFARITHP